MIYDFLYAFLCRETFSQCSDAIKRLLGKKSLVFMDHCSNMENVGYHLNISISYNNKKMPLHTEL